MNLHNFILGGVRVAFDAAWTLEQTYEPMEGAALLRLASGAAVKQSVWSKLRTTISGQGRLPEGLTGLDYGAALTLDCLAPMSKTGASNVITIPAARRSDAPPFGYARVGDRLIATGVSLASNTATLTTVSGASAYLVAWYPSLSVFARPPRQSFNGRGPGAGWIIEAEEI